MGPTSRTVVAVYHYMVSRSVDSKIQENVDIDRLLPLAAVITPGTLTVASAANARTTMMKVPEIDFVAVNATVAGSFDTDGHDLINLQRIAMTAGAQGGVLQLPSAFPNNSYSLTFSGPTVSCKVVEDERSILALQRIYNFTSVGHMYYYFAFVPRDYDLAVSVNLSLTDKQFYLIDEWSADANSIYVTRRVNLTSTGDDLGKAQLSILLSIYYYSYTALIRIYRLALFRQM